MSNDGASTEALDLKAFRPEDFAKLIAGANDEMIAEVINGPQRKQVLDEICNRMADHVEGDKVKDIDTVVHFKILDRPRGPGRGL